MSYLILQNKSSILSREYNAFAHCRNMKADLFPTQRKLFFNGTLYQRVPPNPEQILRTYYGQHWKSPPSKNKQKPHGGGKNKLCPFGPNVTFQESL